MRRTSLACLVFLFTLPSFGQSMTTITATTVDAGNGAVTGSLCAKVENSVGQPISVTKSGGGIYLANRPFCAPLVAGALSGTLSVPNSVTDSAPGHGYDLIIFDTVNHLQTDLGIVFGIGGATWSLDSYVPPSTAPTAQAFTFTTGTGSAPTSCHAPALDIRVNGGSATVSVCWAGAFLAASGTGGGGTGPQGPAGSTGATGAAGSSGAPGAQGIQGATGSTGPIGPTGLTGATGAAGSTGATGSQGIQGTTGTTGTQGIQGATGTAGGSTNWRGAWSGATAYAINDAIANAGSSYIATAASTNQVPPNASYWSLLAQVGATGSQGIQGTTGTTGATGSQGIQGSTGATGPNALSTATTSTMNCALAAGTANVQCATGAQMQTAIGAGVYDASGAATAAVTTAETYANSVNTTGTSAGLSANITESKVTNLVTDLAAKQAALTNPVTGPGSGATVGHMAGIGNVAGTTITDLGAVPTLASLGGVATTVTVNGHALSANVVVSASDLTTGTLPHGQLPTLLTGDIPNNAANTSGTAAGLSGITFATVTDGSPATWAIGSATVANATLTLVHATSTRAINLTGLVNGGSYVLILKQDSTGGAAATLGSGCTWYEGGSAGFTALTTLALTATASAINILAFTYDGTNCYSNLR
jgi:hypothetical protein